jgi:hypothetical protein
VSAHQLTTRSLALALLAVSISPYVARANDQQKAEKQCKKMTAMSADATARTIISQSMADFLKVDRMQLVRERRTLNLTYGSLFVAHELAPSDVQLAIVAAQLQNGKSVVQVANDSKADWHAIAEAAKKFNARIEDDVYKHFLRAEVNKQIVPADKYNPQADVIKADADVTPEEIAQAHQIYVFWRDRAAPNRAANLDTASQTAVGKSADVFKGGDRPRP